MHALKAAKRPKYVMLYQFFSLKLQLELGGAAFLVASLTIATMLSDKIDFRFFRFNYFNKFAHSYT